MPRYSSLLNVLWLRMVMAALGGLCLMTEAGAVITVTTGFTGTRTITMRVGTATSGVVDVVQFNVANSPTGNFQAAVTANIVGNGTPIAASSGAVSIGITMSAPAPPPGNQDFTITVTSPANLTCASGGCGSTTIPFSSISWTSGTQAGASNSDCDIQNGTFAGGTTQALSAAACTGRIQNRRVWTWVNSMTFSYLNASAYPAGSYTGRVTYTATFL